MEVELVLDAHATIGESPTWSPEEQALYWVDIKAPALHRYDPADGATRDWLLPSEIGAFALAEPGRRAVVALRDGLFSLDLTTAALAPLAPAPFDPAVFRFNEGACDDAGRFWLGTMFDPRHPLLHRKRPGTLHHWSSRDGLVPHADAALTPNGMAWSPDGRLFYLSHSDEREVRTFSFDVEAGTLGTPQRFAGIPEGLGIPDGAAVDQDGGYWCALHGGGRLRRFTPDGAMDRDVPLPVSQPTMCAFGGADLDVLYVTSKAEGLDPQQRLREPHAGGLFRLRPGVRGLPRPWQVA